MFSTLAKRGLLMVLVAVGCAGCVEEDSITIASDGLVKVESVVTVSDADKKLDFAALDKAVSEIVAELQQAMWTVEHKWLSKERPYRFQVSGSGRIGEVNNQTRFYHLTPVLKGFFRVTFPRLESDGGRAQRRIVFTTGESGRYAEVHDSRGGSIAQIESVAPEDIYTIRLR